MKEPAVERMERALAAAGSVQGRTVRDIIASIVRAGKVFYPGSQWSQPDPALTVRVSHGDVVYQFSPEQLPTLEELAAKLEAEVSKPTAVIAASNALDKLIAERAAAEEGFLKLAKAAADKRINTMDTWAVLEGMRAYAELSGAPVSPTTLAIAHQNILVFAMPEDQALEKVRAIVVPKKRAAPEKVAVKMALLRIRKIQKAVRDQNERLAEEMATEDWKSRMQHLPKEAHEPIPPVPVDGDRASLAKYLEMLGGRMRTQYSTQDLRKEMARILNREDMTDDALAEALRIAQVEEVMDS